MSVTTEVNNDGLIRKYGTNEAKSLQQGGAVCHYGPYSTLVLNLDLTNLDQTEAIQNDVLVIPEDSLIESVEFVTIVEAATGTAVDIGLIANDRNTNTDITGSLTSSDPDGLVAAYPAAAMSSVGEWEKHTQVNSIPASPSGTVGAAVGEILVAPCLITASQTDGTDFTAGKVQVRVNFIPNATSGFGEVH